MKQMIVSGRGCCALLALAVLGGCVEPGAIKPTLAAQRAAMDRIASSYAADLELLHDQLDAASGTVRTQTLGRLHRELIASGEITPALEPDAEALDRALTDAASSNGLAGEVRAGRLSRAAAGDFLHDYALAMRMTREGAAVRATMLARLGEVQALDASAKKLRAAMAEHAADVKRLLDDAGAATDSLDAFARAPSLLDDASLKTAASALWRSLAGSQPAVAPAEK